MLKKCMETLQHETQKLSGALQVIMNSMKIEHESPEKILNDSPAQSNNRPFQLFSPIKLKFDSSEQANDKYDHHSDDQYSILRKKIKINPTSKYYSIPKTVEDCFKTPEFRMLPKDIPVSTLLKEFQIPIPGRPSLLERESKYGAKWRYDQLALWKFKKTFFNFVTKTSEELNFAPSVVAQIMDTIAQQQGLRGMASMRVKIQDSLLQKEMLREISNILTDQQETNNNNEVI
ncbi:hypothetical protein METBIDRAFT_107155 [Metschnikowia bicuspidata var. bicuspidata NRRL YB-4993]|uniref:Transcription activator GCR1-like domain-containing protein n=1 Tax=Metschnikowia bicuspidata var. bicuspidata NRRL YB-4993 TaxID=869754 RepID=A0A1A0HI48_9ASCO|nr:hypothetical protein METBIDRAFT_107155 [Metschnikowia bicuspidata var. bicuspidata NRRL YB-4993]OBA23518.1 hypothetical protein METBIDRAFT_107155 [Metschnikowia bicuspidata var. bicuspidata NRRL YB-4993]